MIRTLGILLAGLFACSLIEQTAWAGNLNPPYDMDTASILPKGVRSPRYKNIFMQMEDRYNNQGVSEPLGASLNKTVTFQTLVDSQPTAKDRALAEGTVLASQNELSSSPGSTSGRVNTFVDIKVPYFAYGLSENNTIALVIPVYDIRVDASTGFVPSERGQRWVDTIAKSNPEKAMEIRGLLRDPAQDKLRSMGYKPIQSERTQGIGDVKFVWKTQIVNNEKNTFTLKSAVTAPTGIRPDADKVVDTATGDGQWDVGVRALWDLYASRSFTFNTYAGYLAQLPDQLERRIPTSRGDSLSPDKDEVYRDMGDQTEAGVGLTVGNSSDGLSGSTFFTYQFMQRTKYHGVRYEGSRYGWLEELSPEQELYAVTFGAAYSTIGAYRSKTFALPLTVNAYVGHPLYGKNVSNVEIYSAELILYF